LERRRGEVNTERDSRRQGWYGPDSKSIFVGMQTRCPKCTSIVRSTGTSWEILNKGCVDLAGTRWADQPEFCPTLSHIVQADVILPGVADREVVLAEIAQVRVVKVHP
jgi:hypothetical protein